MKNEIKYGRSLRLSNNIIIQDVNATIIRDCQITMLTINTKTGIIKIILYAVLERSNGEPLLVLIYINDLYSNISNTIDTKATFFI